MNETSGRLNLPFIMPGQAQKEITHNEALARIDIAVARSVLGVATAPPTDPSDGDCWIVAPAATGEWAGQRNAIAAWTDGGWRFVTPWSGLSVWRVDRSCEMRFVEGAWRLGQIVGEGLVLRGQAMLGGPVSPVAEPSGGAVVDGEARAAIGAVIAALQHHGLLAAAKDL